MYRAVHSIVLKVDSYKTNVYVFVVQVEEYSDIPENQ
jgi:hypothetical protein